MACKPVCKLCSNLVISQTVTFTGGNVVIDIPAGSYTNGEKVCLVIAQAIPTTATITAPVVITIGGGAQQYPLTTSCCGQVTACGIRTRTRYSAVIVTNATSATFRMLGKPACMPNNALESINGTAPEAATPAE